MYGLRTMTVAASAAVVAAALLGTGTVLVLDGLHHKGAPPVIAASLGPNAAPAPLASSSDRASSPAGQHHQGSGGSRPAAGSPDSTPQPTPNPGTSSAPGGHSGGGGNPNPTPTRAHSSSPPASSPPPSPGSLTAAPDSVTLTEGSSGAYSGSFQITAVGGPVSGYSIEDPAPPGDLSISPSGGSLSSGGTATITISVASSSGLAYETDLTVDPGGLTIVVDYPPAG